MLDSLTLWLLAHLIWAFEVDYDFVKAWHCLRCAGVDASEPLIKSDMA